MIPRVLLALILTLALVGPVAAQPEPAADGFTPVDSGVVEAVKYDSGANSLTLRFHDGASITYLEVPSRVYEEFMEIRTKGGFIRGRLDGRHPTTDVVPAPSAEPEGDAEAGTGEEPPAEPVAGTEAAPAAPPAAVEEVAPVVEPVQSTEDGVAPAAPGAITGKIVEEGMTEVVETPLSEADELDRPVRLRAGPARIKDLPVVAAKPMMTVSDPDDWDAPVPYSSDDLVEEVVTTTVIVEEEIDVEPADVVPMDAVDRMADEIAEEVVIEEVTEEVAVLEPEPMVAVEPEPTLMDEAVADEMLEEAFEEVALEDELAAFEEEIEEAVDEEIAELTEETIEPAVEEMAEEMDAADGFDELVDPTLLEPEEVPVEGEPDIDELMVVEEGPDATVLIEEDPMAEDMDDSFEAFEAMLEEDMEPDALSAPPEPTPVEASVPIIIEEEAMEAAPAEDVLDELDADVDSLLESMDEVEEAEVVAEVSPPVQAPPAPALPAVPAPPVPAQPEEATDIAAEEGDILDDLLKDFE